MTYEALCPVEPRDVGIEADSVDAIDAAVAKAEGRVFEAGTVLVARNGGVFLERAYGWLDPETRARPARINSLFDLASVTKMYAVTLFMTLVEAQLVTLDEPVVEVLPELGGRRGIGRFEHPLTGAIEGFDYPGEMVDATRITFRHLLTHTSGLPAWLPLYRVEAELSVLPRIFETDFAYPTGARIVYSDLGLILLAEAMQRVLGEPLDTALRTRVLEPLGAADTMFRPGQEHLNRVAPTEVCRWRKRRIVGEVHDENAGRLGGVSGHAGLFATAADVARLGQMYLNGGTYNGTRVLRTATVAEMTRVQAEFEGDRRGLGWMLQGIGSMRRPGLSDEAYGHTGFTGTALWVDPTTGVVIVLLTNRVYFGRDGAGILALREAVYTAVERAVRSEP